MSVTTYRGWNIMPATIGFDIQHPDYDRENEIDWRHGHADSIDGARIEIDRLLAEDAEWTKAASIVKQWQGEHATPKPPAGGDAVMTAALNQNDAMRQELAHVGNLVSVLARAMKVDQANDDGSWPDLAGRVQRLTAAALALPAPVVEGGVVAACGRIQKWMDDEHRTLAPGEAGAGLSYDDVTTVLRAALSEGRSHG